MERFYREGESNWRSLQELHNRAFMCGFCMTNVSSVKGYKLGKNSDGSGDSRGGISICPNCGGPTFFNAGTQISPVPSMGNSVAHVPEDLYALYLEARRSTSQSAYTGAVLLCRKMLMNIAVHQGAKEGKSFMDYVKFLADSGFVPPHGKHWVDHIRKKGNEATHEIAVMTQKDARELISFVEMLLRFIYEFPAMVPQPESS